MYSGGKCNVKISKLVNKKCVYVIKKQNFECV